MIGLFPIARTVFEYDNQILIGHIRERHVVRKKAAVCGEERCVTSLKTAAKETTGKGDQDGTRHRVGCVCTPI